MMIYDPYEYEAEVKQGTCRFHQLNPGVAFAGCTCWCSFSWKRTGRLKPHFPSVPGDYGRGQVPAGKDGEGK